jgi:hypothetical protein
MTTTPCPICETDADVLPIPDFDSEAFHCPAHGRFEVSRTAMMTPGKRASWSGKELSSAPKLAPAAAGPASRTKTSFESCEGRLYPDPSP